ncbi:hypothetical protein FACS1894187_13620 [Synergistales bacterium]|nr:hypothetical protein FACS1894187_13620 [Synergistales bacterium]
MQPKQCMFLNYNYFIPGANKDGNHFRYCCVGKGKKFPTNGSIEDDYAECMKYIAIRREELGRGILGTCRDCQFLVDGVGKDKQQNSFILNSGLPGGDKCNAGCIYCDSLENKNQEKCKYGVLDIFKYVRGNFESETVYMSYASAEITVSNCCGELLDIWNKTKWRGKIFTSGIKYCGEISDLLNNADGVSLNISLDSGTAETYKKIKRVNKFDAVIDTINRYRKDKVELKYNLIHGYNSEEVEIEKFLDLCAAIGPKFVCLSNNQNEQGHLDEKLHLAEYFIEIAYKRGIKVNLTLDYFHNYTFQKIKDYVVNKPYLNDIVKFEYK